MSLVSMIATDHRRVDALFQRIEQGDPDARGLLQEATRELSVHAAAEEQVVYPALRDAPGGTSLADEALAEHREIKQALADLEHHDGPNVAMHGAFRQLASTVRHHAAEEESTLLPALRDAIGEEAMDRLGQAFAAAKLTAPTHPHPHAPDTPPGVAVAGAAAALVDTARDLAHGVAPPTVQAPGLPEQVALGIGALRMAIGGALLVAPGVAGRIWVGPGGSGPGERVFARAVGARDVVLGWHTVRVAQRGTAADAIRLLQLGAFADAADAAATVLASRDLTRLRRVVMPLVAGTVAALGLAMTTRLSPGPAASVGAAAGGPDAPGAR